MNWSNLTRRDFLRVLAAAIAAVVMQIVAAGVSFAGQPGPSESSELNLGGVQVLRLVKGASVAQATTAYLGAANIGWRGELVVRLSNQQGHQGFEYLVDRQISKAPPLKPARYNILPQGKHSIAWRDRGQRQPIFEFAVQVG